MSSTTSRATTAAANPTHRADAACSSKDVDPDLFFPVGENLAARAQAERAKQVCMGCLIRTGCLSWALETRQDEGVLGGMTEEERRAVHGRRRRYSFRRNAAAHIIDHQLPELVQLQAQGLPVLEVAQALGTNVQTINHVTAHLAAQARAEEVRAA